jgi:hypothetical protein
MGPPVSPQPPPQTAASGLVQGRLTYVSTNMRIILHAYQQGKWRDVFEALSTSNAPYSAKTSCVEGGREGLGRERSQLLRQPGFVNRSHLIKQDQSPLAAVRNSDAKRCWAACGGHRRDNRGTQVVMHFSGRHYDAGTGFLYLAPNRGSRFTSQISPRLTRPSFTKPALTKPDPCRRRY